MNGIFTGHVVAVERVLDVPFCQLPWDIQDEIRDIATLAGYPYSPAVDSENLIEHLEDEFDCLARWYEDLLDMGLINQEEEDVAITLHPFSTHPNQRYRNCNQSS